MSVSKLIEYMACGKAVLSSKLPSITKEYDDFLIYIDDDTEKAMHDSLISIMKMSDDELNALGKANKEFVEENKSVDKQGKRMNDFIEDIINAK